MRQLRLSQRKDQREEVRQTNLLAQRNRRAHMTDQHRDNIRRSRRSDGCVDLNREAFQYDCTVDYSSDSFVEIGRMDVVCNYCGALKFPGETTGLCCLNGKIKLPALPQLTEPLYSLFRGETPESRHFLFNTQRYNGCFQMVSFGADIIEESGFTPTFKIQGQIHHRIGYSRLEMQSINSSKFTTSN